MCFLLRQLVAACAAICAGLALASYGDPQFSAIGTALLMVSLLVGSLRWVVTQVSERQQLDSFADSRVIKRFTQQRKHVLLRNSLSLSSLRDEKKVSLCTGVPVQCPAFALHYLGSCVPLKYSCEYA